MTATAQTSGLTHLPTGKDRLLGLVHWLIALIIIHCLIARLRELATIVDRQSVPDVTRILRRAVAVQVKVLACRPTALGLPIEARRAMAAAIVGIIRDIDAFRAARTKRPAPAPSSRRGGSETCPHNAIATPPIRRRSTTAAATGPPYKHRGYVFQNAGVPLELFQACTRVCRSTPRSQRLRGEYFRLSPRQRPHDEHLVALAHRRRHRPHIHLAHKAPHVPPHPVLLVDHAKPHARKPLLQIVQHFAQRLTTRAHRIRAAGVIPQQRRQSHHDFGHASAASTA
jgi:hypothetical protein